MEWVLANYELVFAALGGLFYIAEKIVKQNKKTGWNDILIDGAKWLAGKGPKKPPVIMIFLLLLPLSTISCFTGPQVIPVGCENSVIVNQIPNYKELDFILKLANVQAIKGDLYTKSQALETLNDFETVLNQGITYASFASLVMEKVNWVNKSAGVEIFILSEYVGLFEKPLEIDACDKDLLLKHIEKQKIFIQMIH